MITLISKDPSGGRVKVDLPDDVTLDECLMYMGHFLRACTYIFDGDLQIVERGKPNKRK